MSIHLTIGEKIEDLIKAKKSTQAKEAKEMCVAASMLSDIINGNRKEIRSDTLIKLCKHFNVSADWLLGLSQTRSVDENIQCVCATTGLSNNAVDILCSIKSDPYYSMIISGIIESKHFPALLENLESALKCRESTHVKFVNEYADMIQELARSLEKISGTDLIAEYEPNIQLLLNDSVFDKTLSDLSELAPNMTALNRNDAVKFYLQEAQHSFRQAAEDAI